MPQFSMIFHAYGRKIANQDDGYPFKKLLD